MRKIEDLEKECGQRAITKVTFDPNEHS